MTPPARIRIVSVPVSDREWAKLFYSQVLGFDVVDDSPMGDGQRWIELRPPGGEASITLVTWFPSMPPGSQKGLVLETDDIDTSYDDLHARGVDFDHLPADAPWGRFATFQDPDGNGWVLSEAGPKGA